MTSNGTIHSKRWSAITASGEAVEPGADCLGANLVNGDVHEGLYQNEADHAERRNPRKQAGDNKQRQDELGIGAHEDDQAPGKKNATASTSPPAASTAGRAIW